MFGNRFAALAAAVVICLGAPAGAQTLQSIDGPAERPPASYQGKQYVDSRGCVFIRAGYGGAVTWIPRVNRSGKVICNARPTRVAGAEPANPRTAAGERPKDGLTTTTARTAPKKVVKTQPVKKKVVASAPAPRVVTKPAAAAPARVVKKVVVRKPVPTAPPAPVQAAPRAGSPACDYGTRSSRYVNSGARYPVRCGPQSEHPAGKPVIGPSVNRAQHSSVLTIPAPRPVTMPKGYKTVWTDDRLNPKRGVGTLSGAIATSLVWTNTVPRRLIDTRTGRDVTLKYAYLVYPYTDYAAQKAALSAQGVAVETVTISTAPAVTRSSKSPVAQPPATVRKSTKSAPNAKLPTASAKPAYIRIGTFTDAAQKDRAVARLRGLGVPVKVGRTTRKGQPATVVVVGPFAGGKNLSPLLGRIKSAGFPAARIRN